jgi:DNA-binding response OmpR family regulator
MLKEPPIVLFADSDITSCRPLRSELRRRGARVLVATSLEQAQEYAELFNPELLVLDEDLASPEIPDPAAYFRNALPSAEMALLRSAPSSTPRGWGLGLLYSGTKEGGHELLLEAIEQAFPARLGRTSMPPASPRVLCVDDDPLCLNSLSRLLTRHGYRVFTSENPREAVSAVRGLMPDLALVDVSMPGMDGYDVTREIRRQFAALIPVVLISGRPAIEGRAAGRVHGANDYVAKPCDPRHLLDIVDYYAADLDTRELELIKPRLMEDR